jgi:hypothetical protein
MEVEGGGVSRGDGGGAVAVAASAYIVERKDEDENVD